MVSAGDALIEAIADAVAERLEKMSVTRQRLLPLERAAEYLGMSENQVLNLISEGRLKPSRVDRRIRIDVRELDRLVEETKRAS
jgi:excisionase family DNA binding protein